MIQKVLAADDFYISNITKTKPYQDVFGGFKFADKNLTDILSALLPYIFALAGLALFAAIIYSGFQFLTSTGDPKKTGEAKGCLTSAITGFLIIVLSYWLVQALEIFFHISVFGGP